MKRTVRIISTVLIFATLIFALSSCQAIDKVLSIFSNEGTSANDKDTSLSWYSWRTKHSKLNWVLVFDDADMKSGTIYYCEGFTDGTGKLAVGKHFSLNTLTKDEITQKGYDAIAEFLINIEENPEYEISVLSFDDEKDLAPGTYSADIIALSYMNNGKEQFEIMEAIKDWQENQNYVSWSFIKISSSKTAAKYFKKITDFSIDTVTPGRFWFNKFWDDNNYVGGMS